MLEGQELVPGAHRSIATSAQTGAGLPELLAALEQRCREAPSESRRSAATRLFVDRAFTLKGIGTVVTGTLWSGSIERGRRSCSPSRST